MPCQQKRPIFHAIWQMWSNVIENFKIKKMSNFSVINLQKELSFTMGMNRGHIKSMGKKNLRI